MFGTRRAALTVAAFLTILVVGATFVFELSHAAAPTVFLVVPIAILAIEYGLIGGIVGAVLAVLAAIGMSNRVAEAELSEIGVISRAAAFFTTGGLIGLYADRFRRTFKAQQALTQEESAARVEGKREQEKLEERLRQSERIESVGRLAGGIAHDFNNLLAVILNYASFVEDEIDASHPAQGDVVEIRKAAERAAELTHQLLIFSRREIVETASLDLNELVTDVEKLLRRTLGEHVDLQLALSSDLPPVSANRGQVEQVLVNLAVNARDAMSGGGVLTIETAGVELDESYAGTHTEVEPGSYVRLAVADSGEGMPADVASRAFEPFFTTKQPGEGTGLGLATVYGIVKAASGHVELYSEIGTGTVFKVYLPAASTSVERADARPRDRALAAEGEAILLVEDEAAVRKMTERILAGAGYEVLAAGTPAEAVTIHQEHSDRISLLVTDVVMPGRSGPALASQLTESHPDLAVLYISGYTDDFVARHGMLEEGSSMLGKPFNATELLTAVRKSIDTGPRGRPAPAGH